MYRSQDGANKKLLEVLDQMVDQHNIMYRPQVGTMQAMLAVLSPIMYKNFKEMEKMLSPIMDTAEAMLPAMFEGQKNPMLVQAMMPPMFEEMVQVHAPQVKA